jgi:hypothetical protein
MGACNEDIEGDDVEFLKKHNQIKRHNKEPIEKFVQKDSVEMVSNEEAHSNVNSVVTDSAIESETNQESS